MLCRLDRLYKNINYIVATGTPSSVQEGSTVRDQLRNAASCTADSRGLGAGSQERAPDGPSMLPG